MKRNTKHKRKVERNRSKLLRRLSTILIVSVAVLIMVFMFTNISVIEEMFPASRKLWIHAVYAFHVTTPIRIYINETFMEEIPFQANTSQLEYMSGTLLYVRANRTVTIDAEWKLQECQINWTVEDIKGYRTPWQTWFGGWVRTQKYHYAPNLWIITKVHNLTEVSE